jgi:hypothetical protein
MTEEKRIRTEGLSEDTKQIIKRIDELRKSLRGSGAGDQIQSEEAHGALSEDAREILKSIDKLRNVMFSHIKDETGLAAPEEIKGMSWEEKEAEAKKQRKHDREKRPWDPGAWAREELKGE